MPSITVNTALVSIPRFVDFTFFCVLCCPHAITFCHVDEAHLWYTGWWKRCEALMACVLICGCNELYTFFGHFHTFWFRLAGITDFRQLRNIATHTPLRTHTQTTDANRLPSSNGGNYYEMRRKYGGQRTKATHRCIISAWVTQHICPERP